MYCCELLGEWSQLPSYDCISFRTYEDTSRMFIIQRRKNEKRDGSFFIHLPKRAFYFQTSIGFQCVAVSHLFHTRGPRTLVSERQHPSLASTCYMLYVRD